MNKTKKLQPSKEEALNEFDKCSNLGSNRQSPLSIMQKAQHCNGRPMCPFILFDANILKRPRVVSF